MQKVNSNIMVEKAITWTRYNKGQIYGTLTELAKPFIYSAITNNSGCYTIEDNFSVSLGEFLFDPVHEEIGFMGYNGYLLIDELFWYYLNHTTDNRKLLFGLEELQEVIKSVKVIGDYTRVTVYVETYPISKDVELLVEAAQDWLINEIKEEFKQFFQGIEIAINNTYVDTFKEFTANTDKYGVEVYEYTELDGTVNYCICKKEDE